MVELNPPLWIQAGEYTANLDATAIAAWLLHDDAAQQIREGVVFNNTTNLQVTAQGTSVGIADGRAVIDNTHGGAYLCTNRGSSLTGIDPTGNASRRDIVGVRVFDTENGQAGNLWRFYVVKGSASVTTDPVFPPYFIPLARVRMPANTSVVNASFIDDMRRWTTTAGGPIVCTSSTRPGVLRNPLGQIVYETDSGLLRFWDGAAWRMLPSNGRFTATGPTNTVVQITGAAGQTAPLQRWQDSNGNAVATLTPSTGSTVPAVLRVEGDLSAAGSIVSGGAVLGNNLRYIHNGDVEPTFTGVGASTAYTWPTATAGGYYWVRNGFLEGHFETDLNANPPYPNILTITWPAGLIPLDRTPGRFQGFWRHIRADGTFVIGGRMVWNSSISETLCVVEGGNRAPTISPAYRDVIQTDFYYRVSAAEAG